VAKASWVAYVGPFQFPWGQPGSRRVDGVARSLAALGYDVIVGSGEDCPGTPQLLEDVEGPGSVTYVGLCEAPSSDAGRLKKSGQVLLNWGRRTVDWLDAQTSRPSHVIVYGGGTQYAARLREWCSRNQIPLVADVVEWYSSRQMIGGFFSPVHLSAKGALRYYYPRCDGIIAISSFLERHFRARGCRVIRVPPTLDVRGLQPSGPSRDSGRLTLLYFGTPGRKDLLSNIIRGVDRANDDCDRLRLRIVGPTLDQIRALLGGETVPECVESLGRVPQEEVTDFLQAADFSVLLREPKRFAQAGFPTKFSESLANGVPVIANLTSDLKHYLSDGVEGLVCGDHSVETFAETLRRALRLSDATRSAMREAARQQALASFDFRAVSDQLGRFFDEMRP
jgi:glycosyltransferase involved in cell wall biosynthesis